MSPIGHTIVGATLAATLMDERLPSATRGKVFLAIIVAANLPDLPFPYWGHSRYDISHSIFTGLVVVAIFCLVARRTNLRNTFAGRWRFIVAGTLAIYSHYFLDTMYNHGKGIALFWPISEARVALPVPWLSHMEVDPLLSVHNVEVWTVELVVFGSLSAVILLATMSLSRKN